jgi:hypothetical protein
MMPGPAKLHIFSKLYCYTSFHDHTPKDSNDILTFQVCASAVFLSLIAGNESTNLGFPKLSQGFMKIGETVQKEQRGNTDNMVML